MKKFKKFVEIAIAMKPVYKKHRYFHVAFVLDKKKIIAIGWNNVYKTHPKINKYPYHPDAKLHAEMSAILKLRWIGLNDMTLVVLRLDSKNMLKNSKPCKGCQALINEVGIAKVWYSDEDQKFHKLLIR